MKLTPVLVGVLLDLLDWLGWGMIPLLCDIVDALGIYYYWKVEKLDVVAALGAVELFPGLDVLPTFTALGSTRRLKEAGSNDRASMLP